MMLPFVVLTDTEAWFLSTHQNTLNNITFIIYITINHSDSIDGMDITDHDNSKI